MAKKKMEEADKIVKQKKEELKASILDELNDEKKAPKLYSKHLSDYAKPKINTIIGTFFAMIAGLIAPMFGFFFVKNMFTTMVVDYEKAIAAAMGV